MYTAKVENKKGDILRLTGNESYEVLDIDGLTPGNAQITTAATGGMDGERLQHTSIEKRNIVIKIKPTEPVEQNRINLYKFFRLKEIIKFYYKNSNRDVYIEGYTESVTGSLFSEKEILQISIICPDPFFKELSPTVSDASQVEALFEFPFAIRVEGVSISEINMEKTKNIYNKSDLTTGVRIFLNARGKVKNPTIYNRNTGEKFGLNIVLQEGDRVTISTISGRKSVILERNGEIQNILKYVSKKPTWFQLEPGDNAFVYEIEEGGENLMIEFETNVLYEGV